MSSRMPEAMFQSETGLSRFRKPGDLVSQLTRLVGIASALTMLTLAAGYFALGWGGW